MRKRWLLIAVCAVLILVHLLRPDAKVDAVTVWLVVVAIILFLWPELRSAAPYIKRVRLGDAELETHEIRQDVKSLGKEVEQVEAKVAEGSGQTAAFDDVSRDITEVVREASNDPRAALLLLSIKLEQEVRRRLEVAGTVSPGGRYLSLSEAVRRGVAEGVFSRVLADLIQEFWQVRNKIAHGAAFDVSDPTIVAMVSIGIDILKLLSIMPSESDR